MHKLVTSLFACCLLASQVHSIEIQLPVIADSTIRKDFPDTNLSHQPNARADDDITTERHAYFKFDTSQLDGLASQHITSAQVFFYLNFLDGVGEVNFMSVDNDWAESTITWDNAPTASNFIDRRAFTVADAGSYFSVDITSLVKSWVDGAPNYGIAMLPTVGTGVIARIASKENPDISASAYVSVSIDQPVIKKRFLPEITWNGGTTIIDQSLYILNTSETDNARVSLSIKDRYGNLLVDDGSAADGNVYDYNTRYGPGSAGIDYTESEPGKTAVFTLPPGARVFIGLGTTASRSGFSGYGIVEYVNSDNPQSREAILALDAERVTVRIKSDGTLTGAERWQRTLTVAGGNLF